MVLIIVDKKDVELVEKLLTENNISFNIDKKDFFIPYCPVCGEGEQWNGLVCKTCGFENFNNVDEENNENNNG